MPSAFRVLPPPPGVASGAYLADLLARTNRIDEARANFRRLIEASPESARARYGLGRIELEAGHLNEALALLERAVALDANEAAFKTTLGRALLAKWDEDKDGDSGADALRRARAVLSKAADLDPHAVTRWSRSDEPNWQAVPTFRAPRRCSSRPSGSRHRGSITACCWPPRSRHSTSSRALACISDC